MFVAVHQSISSTFRCRQEVAMSEAVLRIQSHLWRWLLIVGPILVLGFAFQSLWMQRAATAHPDSDDISIEADRIAQLADAYIARVAGVTSYFAVTPEVVELAATSSARSFTAADTDAETNWETLAGTKDDPFVSIHGEPVSAFFRDLTAVAGGSYREIFLADAKGRLIAASNRTEDFQQADDSWWPADMTHVTASCRHLPLECVHITDVEWDSSAATFGYDVVLPVVTSEGHAVGVLKAVVDPRELNELLSFAESSHRFDVALINAKGMRLLSHERFFDEQTSSKLRELTPGSEASWQLAGSRKNGPIAFVRRLSSPIEEGWTIAVADRDHGDAGLRKTYVLWCLFMLGLFVITARAFAVTVPGRNEAPGERR
jgi:hypothetical protein